MIACQHIFKLGIMRLQAGQYPRPSAVPLEPHRIRHWQSPPTQGTGIQNRNRVNSESFFFFSNPDIAKSSFVVNLPPCQTCKRFPLGNPPFGPLVFSFVYHLKAKEMTKTLIIDDTDPNISYTGNWKPLGPISDTSHEFNGTVRRGDAKDQSLSYKFNGTRITVYGSLDKPKNNLVGVEFQVDNNNPEKINSTGTLTWQIDQLHTHLALYQSSLLSDGEHTINIKVTNATADGPYFYFDFFTVDSNKNKVTGNVIVDDRDNSITYVPQWDSNGVPIEYMGTTTQSPKNGSTASFQFTGAY
jgi:hypothetical protein